MSKTELYVNDTSPASEQLTKYHNKTRYKLAIRLCIALTLVFSILSISFYREGLSDFLAMLSGAIVSGLGLAYTYFTKKFILVFWLLSFSGIFITSFTLFTLDKAVHYADFIWLFSSIVLAFFGINKKVGITLLTICFCTIVIYCFFFVNVNITNVTVRSTEQKLMLTIELIGALSTGVYVLYLFADHHYYSMKLMTTINQELKEQNKTIDSKSYENETLIKEVHHRVKNNLQIITSLLRMQSHDLKYDDSKRHFDVAIKRVMTMSLIHQKLYQNKNLSEINLQNYLESLTDELTQVVDEDKMKISTTIEVGEVGMKTIVPLGLLINELVSNSIKYVIPQKQFVQIFIHFKESIHGYTLTYQDNGSWEEDHDLSENESTGFGSQLIDILTEQMEGKKELTKGVGNTKYEFHLKNLDLV